MCAIKITQLCDHCPQADLASKPWQESANRSKAMSPIFWNHFRTYGTVHTTFLHRHCLWPKKQTLQVAVGQVTSSAFDIAISVTPSQAAATHGTPKLETSLPTLLALTILRKLYITCPHNNDWQIMEFICPIPGRYCDTTCTASVS